MINSAHPRLGPASIFIKAVRRAKRTRWWRLDGLSVHRLLSPFEGSGGTRQPVGGSCADSTVRATAPACRETRDRLDRPTCTDDDPTIAPPRPLDMCTRAHRDSAADASTGRAQFVSTMVHYPYVYRGEPYPASRRHLLCLRLRGPGLDAFLSHWSASMATITGRLRL